MQSALTSSNLSRGVQRAFAAVTILAAHTGVLYLGMTIAHPVPRAIHNSVIAHFVEATVEPREEWKPPALQPVHPAVAVPTPVAPAIEVFLDEPPAQPAAALYIEDSSPPPVAAADTPRFISTVEYLREPAPRYPPQSRRLGEQGLVVLRVLIDEKGQACDIAIESSSGHDRLDHAAKDAVARAMFRPYVEDGAPRRALVLIPIEFSLSSNKA